jgi:hypothetical protein
MLLASSIFIYKWCSLNTIHVQINQNAMVQNPESTSMNIEKVRTWYPHTKDL